LHESCTGAVASEISRLLERQIDSYLADKHSERYHTHFDGRFSETQDTAADDYIDTVVPTLQKLQTNMHNYAKLS
jgi:hypothetical protein